MDPLQHADHEEVRHHRASPDRDERKGNAGHRSDAHRHPDVDEDLEHEGEDEPACHDGAVQIARDGDDPEASPDDEEVEQEQDGRADEATLLRQRRKGEVRGVLGEVVEARLARIGRPPSGQASCADGGDRLVQVPREPARIAVAVDEPGRVDRSGRAAGPRRPLPAGTREPRGPRRRRPRGA